MTEDEIRKEILSDDNNQTHVYLTANLTALILKLVEKGILDKNDVADMDERRSKLVEDFNNRAVEMIIKQIEEDNKHE